MNLQSETGHARRIHTELHKLEALVGAEVCKPLHDELMALAVAKAAQYGQPVVIFAGDPKPIRS